METANLLKKVVITILLLIVVLVVYVAMHALGFFDVHVSQIDEGPNFCVKITEEWYRWC